MSAIPETRADRAAALKRFDAETDGAAKQYSRNEVSVLILAACEQLTGQPRKRHTLDNRALLFASGLVAGGLVLLLLSVILSSCRPPPPVYESPDAIEHDVDACAGALVSAAWSADRAQLRYSRDGKFYVLEWIGGEMLADPLVTGGAPGVRLADGEVCATGSLEGDACLSALWSRGQCWPVAPVDLGAD